MKLRYAWALLFSLLFTQGGSAQNLLGFEFRDAFSREELVEKYGGVMQYGVELYKINYTTRDVRGRPDTASGLICVPDIRSAIMPVLCYQHGTVDGKDDVPSNLRGGYQIAEVFAGLGYFSVAPDYIGLGDSRGFHPYVHADSEAWAAVDMLFAARQFAWARGFTLNDQLFITGYSQGGHAAAALQREIEANFRGDFSITASAPLSGPYSISGVMRDLILSDEEYFFPGYVPNTILSYQTVYELYDDLAVVFNEPYYSLIDQYYRGELGLFTLNDTLRTLLIDEFGACIPKRMVRDSVVENISLDPEHPFNLALADNDVYEWAPAAPTRLLYCRGDDQVPFLNSVVAETAMRALGANDLAAFNLNDNFDHGQCVEPAVLTTALFFAQFQNLETSAPQPLERLGARVYPNPAQERVFLEGAPAGAMVELFDLSGRLLRGRLASAELEEIALDGLSPGWYLLRVSAGGRVFYAKVGVAR
jgi:hypothetical protein